MRASETDLSLRDIAAGRTIGVELEYLVVDATGYRAHDGPELVHTDDRDDPGELQSELIRCQGETTTAVCQGAQDAYDQLVGLRERAAKAAADGGLRVVGSGTSVLSRAGRPRLTSGPATTRSPTGSVRSRTPRTPAVATSTSPFRTGRAGSRSATGSVRGCPFCSP
jgi:hypothetical protein